MAAKQKRERSRRRSGYTRVFLNGKEKWLKRPATIDGCGADEFIAGNVDPLWLHQNEMWECIDALPAPMVTTRECTADPSSVPDTWSDDDELPF